MQNVNTSRLLVILLVVLSTSSLAQNATQLFVKPSNDTQCPGNPCLTLSQYVEQQDQYFVSGTTLQFLAGNHILQGDSLIIIQNIANFVMAGASNRSRILCSGSAGLLFYNVSFLRVYNLSFVYCGAPIPLQEQPQGLRATLNLFAVYDFLMSSSSVENGRGYGLLGVNVFDGTISDSEFIGNNYNAFNVCDNCFRSSGMSECIGGNVYFQYIDYSEYSAVKPKYGITITNSSFLFGVNLGPGQQNRYLNRGSGLTFELSQNYFNLMITLSGVISRRNTAVIGANLHITTSDTAAESTAVLIHNSTFEFGNADVSTECLDMSFSTGAGMVFFFGNLEQITPTVNSDVFRLNVLTVSHTIFRNNLGGYAAGISMSLIESSTFNYTRYITFEHCTFDQNVGISGPAVDVLSQRRDGGIQGQLDNIGILRASTVLYLEISNCTFSFNALTALTITGTNVIFRGHNSFMNNVGQYGGALSLRSQSTIYMLPNSQMDLVNNRVTRLGGAIFVDGSNHCFLEIYDPALSLDPNIHFTFVNNSAFNAGGILYGGSDIDQCVLHSTSSYMNSPTGVVLDYISNYTNNDPRTSQFSSDPNTVCFCDGDIRLDCSSFQRARYNTSVFPGLAFTISAVSVGQRMGVAPAVIRANVEQPPGTRLDANIRIGNLESSQSTGKACSRLQYTMFSTRRSETLQLQVQSLPNRVQNNVPFINPPINEIYITLLPCPPAFELSNVSAACECDSELLPYTSTCNLTTQTIERSGDYWVAAYYINTTYEGLIIHEHCPFDYCRPASDVFDFDPRDPEVQCAFNRSGLLCGACESGLSLALGTSRCLQCSDSYLALLVPFAIAGVALVVFLLVLKMTVSTGTINGLIFFANIVAANQAIFFPPGSSNVLTVFIAWLNLDLGIETCFYDGMDEYARIWLQFAFPIYVWATVGTIIVVSHFISTISRFLGDNPISVLATLFLISYAKILRTVYASLSYSFLVYPNGSVVTAWLYDGNIQYLRGKHIPLFIAAVLYLLFVFFPFTLLLFLWPWLQAKSNSRLLSWVNSPKLKPLMDSYTAPYRDKQRYWTGMLLLFRGGLFLAFAVNTPGDPSINLLCITIASLTIAFLAWNQGGVYKRWYLDILESFFILQLGFLSAATYDVRARGGNQAAVVYTFVGVNLGVFTVLVILHIYWQLKEHFGFPNVLKRQTADFSDTPVTSNIVQTAPTKPVSTSVVELRESLLASVDS